MKFVDTLKAMLRGNRRWLILLALVAVPTFALAVTYRTITIGSPTIPGRFKLGDGSTNYMTWLVPALSADYTLTWPTTDGTANYALVTDGDGTLSWAATGAGDTGLTAGSVPFIDATGGDLDQSNANFFFDETTNAMYLKLGSGTGAGTLRLLEGSGGGTNYIDIKAASTLAGNITLTLPNAAPTTSGQVLSATTAGAGSWAERVAQLAANTTESSVVGNAGATAYTFTGQGSDTIPANKFNNIGRSVTVFIGGDATTDGSESETLQHTFKLAAQTILASTAADFSTATTNGAWFATITLTTTDVTVPAAAKVQASGFYCVDPGAAGAGLIEPISALLTVDSTGTLQVTATATWANGDASPDVANMDTLTILDGDVN